MHEEKMISSFDGTKLYFRKDVPDVHRAVVVISHGVHEHLNRYDHFAEKLNEAGIATYRFDHRGHGRSEGPKVFYNDYNEIADDINCVVELAKSENPGLPVFAFGHSMGGFGTAVFATKYPGKVSGVILSGAPTRQNKQIVNEMPIKGNPQDFIKGVSLGGGICHDEKLNAEHRADPLATTGMTVGVMNAMYYGVKWLKENPDRFVDPVLILHGCCDGPVSEKDSRDFFGEIASKDKTLKIYALLFHEILNEPCRDDIIAEIVTWLNRHIDAAK